MALTYNVNAAKSKSRMLKPSDFSPFTAEKGEAVQGDISALKVFLRAPKKAKTARRQSDVK